MALSGRRFLFVAANEGAAWGGSELLWSASAEKLLKRGYEVSVSVREWGFPVPQVERLRAAGCEIFYRRAPSLLKRVGRKVFSSPEQTYEHLKSAAQDASLVVISQGANIDGLPWMEAAKSAGYRYAVVAHLAAEVWWPSDDVAARLSLSYENAAAAYFVSKATLELSRRQFATELEGAQIVQNPFNVRYDARPDWPGPENGELRLACVGRLDAAAKGQDLLFQVLQLSHWRDRPIRVSLFGKGINEQTFRKMKNSLRLTSVEFAGYSENVEEIWKEHHALVLPSRFEGMPLAIVEAMLCRRACIVTDVGGNRELVRDGVSGFVAKAPTVEFLDEAMNRAWENRALLREMGEAAAEDVRRWVSTDPAEDFVQKLIALIDSTTEAKV